MDPSNVSNFGFKFMTCVCGNLKTNCENIIAHKKGKICGLYQKASTKNFLECEFEHRWNARYADVKSGR